jgi:hypothetical protein
MDVTILVKELTEFLAPILPALVMIGGKAAEGASNKLGTEALESAKALWGKLRPKVEAKPAAQEAVRDVAETPKNEDAKAAMRLQLKKILVEDESLADEVSQIWELAKARNFGAISNGDRSVAIDGSVSGSVIVTGDNNQVR